MLKKGKNMKTYSYLIIGGGMTANAAAEGINEIDPAGSIGMFSLEAYPPYKRPALSKDLWKGKPLEKIWLKNLPDGRVDLNTETRIISIDPAARLVKDDQDRDFGYEKLLIATGGKVRRLPYENNTIHYYRTLDDYRELRSLTGQGKNFVVLGGGFIGAEIAAALRMGGEQVSILFPEDGIGARLYPRDLMEFINNYYVGKQIKVLKNLKVTDIRQEGQTSILEIDKGFPLKADVIVAGIGISPDIDLAKAAGITVENGIETDESLVTNLPHIFAAGDAASFFNPALGERLRVEHSDNASAMGKAAGRNMALSLKGLPAEPYHYLPFFYSDLFDLGYEAVGRLDSSLETVSDWQEPFRKGVVYYLREGRIRGVLLWNVWDKVDAARALIAAPGPFSAEKILRDHPIQ
jgi:3-phenylpropionate/trans-cinnamate dioxygenase ferredoxin reductase subunit